MTTDQARQPAGSGTGGQFAAMGRGESDVEIQAPSDQDGTMFFPARFADADEHLSWWRKVDVPDVILQDVLEKYPVSRTSTIRLSLGGNWQDIPRDPSWSDAEYKARNDEAGQEYDKRLSAFRDEIPRDIDRFRVRDAVRLHLAWKYAYTLPQEEQERLRDTEVDLGDLSGTLPAFDRYFSMQGYALDNPETFTRLPDGNEKINAMLARLSAEISENRRVSEQGLRTQLAAGGVTPERAEQIIAGVPVTAKQKSIRASQKEWAKGGH